MKTQKKCTNAAQQLWTHAVSKNASSELVCGTILFIITTLHSWTNEEGSSELVFRTSTVQRAWIYTLDQDVSSELVVGVNTLKPFFNTIQQPWRDQSPLLELVFGTNTLKPFISRVLADYHQQQQILNSKFNWRHHFVLTMLLHHSSPTRSFVWQSALDVGAHIGSYTQQYI